MQTLISLLGVVVPCWYYQAMHAVTPMILGVIAAALSETDDNFSGKLRQKLMMLACFAIASFSVELLFDVPVPFAAGLMISAFGFIMLGAIGSRYASIAFASLLLAVYTMLGAAQSQNLMTQPLLLLAAAAWHSTLSLLWQFLWPNQPVQQSLAKVFDKVESYLTLKARLFDPVSDFSSHEHRLKLAQHNSQLVIALNQTKQILFNRVRNRRMGQSDAHFLKLFFVAQDIHERASSSHYRYEDLCQAFRYSDILFRFQSLLRHQAKACRRLSKAIRSNLPYQHDVKVTNALEEVNQSLTYLRQQQNPDWLQPLSSLKFLLRNLTTIERQLSNPNNPDVELKQDSALSDSEARSPAEMWQLLKSSFNPQALLFRHAVRLSLSLTVGYAVIQTLQLERGYWILLTILFVCQTNFSATRKRLGERMLGTFAGLFLGIPLLYLFPGQEGQLVLMVFCGVAFFATRSENYGVATGFMTLLVLFCFSQLGEGYAVILPRLFDTLAGCGIAALAVRYVLPDWQVRHMPEFMAEAIRANRDYLHHVVAQYRTGKADDLSYRTTRRQAHNRDAALSATISDMLLEPGRFRLAVDESFRMLVLNHALLGYISALGAHRRPLNDPDIYPLMDAAHEQILHRLDLVHDILYHRAALPCRESEIGMQNKLAQWRDQSDDVSRLVLQQLFMIHRMLDEATHLAIQIASVDLTSKNKAPRDLAEN